MTDNSKSSLDKKLDIFSGYQMLGGLIGLVFEIYLLFNLEEIRIAHFFLVGLGIIFYGYSFMSGLFLFQRRSNGLKLSLINQVFQIVGFSLFGYAFEYVSGASFNFVFRNNENFDFSSNIGLSNWHILINGDANIQEISINIIAMLLVLFILRHWNKYWEENSQIEVSK